MMSRQKLAMVFMGLVASLGIGCASARLRTPHYVFNRQTVISGAVLFADHCSACHAVRSLRYSRLASDLGMTKAEIKNEIMLPNGVQYLQGMTPTMTKADATKWFGIAPPNLSHIVRSQGQRWVYTYLTSFYWDPKRPSGWDNKVFPKVAMPNVLAPWGGTDTKSGQVLQAGSESPAAYHKQAADIVAFLRYASDPSVFERRAIGGYVLGVLVVLTILAYLLKKEYWRDVYGKKDITSKEGKG